jgi:lipid II:glycine glycyltransferase (peptidoglycan interpeptide bridge formation enzyme)
LGLKDSYSKLFKVFNKGRKHAVKSGEKNNLTINVTSVGELLNIKKENYNYVKTSNVNFNLLKDIAKYIEDNNKGFVIGVFKQDVILGGAIILKDNKRITYLFSSFNDTGKKFQASTFLLNQLIKKNSESDLLLDFEGSMIPSIASFYRSFGAVKEDYFYCEKYLKSVFF